MTTTTTIARPDEAIAQLTAYQAGQVLSATDNGHLPLDVRRPTLVTLEKHGLVSIEYRNEAREATRVASIRLTRMGYRVRRALRRAAR